MPHSTSFYPNWCWSTITILPVLEELPRIKLICQLLELWRQGLGQDVVKPPEELVANDGGKGHRNLQVPTLPAGWYGMVLVPPTSSTQPETCGCPFTDDSFPTGYGTTVGFHLESRGSSRVAGGAGHVPWRWLNSAKSIISTRFDDFNS